MEAFQTDLYHLPLRHWSEIKRFLKEWADVHYLAFKDYQPFTHVTEGIENTPTDDYPYHLLILQRKKGGGLNAKECRTEAIVWIHKDSKLLRSL